MALTASKLRENIYKILDRVAETGVPVEIMRRSRARVILARYGEVTVIMGCFLSCKTPGME